MSSTFYERPLQCQLKSECGDGEIAEWLEAHTPPTEDMSLVPSIHIRQLTTTCISSSWKSNAVFLS